jgi:DNA polymerase-3 subunit alpha (Gram-positive type)
MAFKTMEFVRKGKAAKKGLEPAMKEAMRQAKIPDWYLDSCEKIKYLFPKAHAVAYVLMAYRIAYFKVHYPAAYYAAYFTVSELKILTLRLINGKDAIKAVHQECLPARF